MMHRADHPRNQLTILLALTLLATLIPSPAARADPVIPPTWDIVADDFESGSLDGWSKVSDGDMSLVAGGGHGGSTGLAIAVSQGESYIYQSHVARAEEGYLTFWFNPNNVAIPDPTPNYWPAGSSLCIAQVRSSAGDWWPPLVSR